MLWWYHGAVISRNEQISKYTEIHNTEGPRYCKLFKCIAETFNWNPFPEQINKQTEIARESKHIYAENIKNYIN